jgi:hypothetical protein
VVVDAAVASSAGIGMRSGPCARSDRIRMFLSCSTASASGSPAHFLDRHFQAIGAFGGIPGDVDRFGAERAVERGSIERILADPSLVRIG